MKKQGMQAGVSDYWILANTNRSSLPVPIGVELKVRKNKLRPSQEDFKVWCESAGVPYYVCRSLDDLENILKEWGIT